MIGHARPIVVPSASVRAESDRLRDCCLRSGWPRAEIARAAGCSLGHIKKWMSHAVDLSADLQAGIRARWTAETGGPG